MDNTIQMNLFEYFIDEEKFSIQDATNLVKNIKNMQVNNESIRARTIKVDTQQQKIRML